MSKSKWMHIEEFDSDNDLNAEMSVGPDELGVRVTITTSDLYGERSGQRVSVVIPFGDTAVRIANAIAKAAK